MDAVCVFGEWQTALLSERASCIRSEYSGKWPTALKRIFSDLSDWTDTAWHNAWHRSPR